jgi:DNA repair protein RadA
LSETTRKLEDVPGIGPVTAQKLRSAGYFTIESIAVASSKELSEATGLGNEKAGEMAAAAREMLEIRFQTAEELLKRREQIDRVSTGSKALDQLLGGGVESQAILELVGEYGTGKTQICHTLCANVQLPRDEGGLLGGAIYIDSEGTFRPERLSQIAESRGLKTDEALRKVMVARAFNSDHQVLIVEKLDELIPKKNIKLVVVDSVISHFRAEYLGRESLTERQQRLNNHLHRLLRTAEVYNIPIVVTNQVLATPDVFMGPITKPAGGHVLAHLSTNRIFLRKGKRDIRIARLIDSPYLPEDECAFVISEYGISDIQDQSEKP